jgi:hypothetical protein
MRILGPPFGTEPALHGFAEDNIPLTQHFTELLESGYALRLRLRIGLGCSTS